MKLQTMAIVALISSLCGATKQIVCSDLILIFIIKYDNLVLLAILNDT